ncbi:DUF5412 family protein [Ureibacillus sp. FSL K6-8385]|uniref:DUF5412 domain-containing protein n=2 Tax=Bacillati TaxID=1783272 RepID=A0A540UX20_9BACL|nr:DUF5412 family protein [Ureibacillus terrenus]MED3662831.1 DUF5412 family protein [Ureibacillus terrenus]MED3762872.1 DUF5412 family protein [Ureibacillus terrenus]TQE89045.1 hypothetical protein FKZ59_12980 [Ureibacillus terrenus]
MGIKIINRANKNYKVEIAVLFIWFFALTIILSYGIHWLFFDMNRFKENLIAQSTSPDGTYTINVYVSDGEIFFSDLIIGELVFNKEEKEPKIIYWKFAEEKANIEWVNDHTVVINDIRLDLPNESYVKGRVKRKRL